jgi:hypothetical protein
MLEMSNSLLRTTTSWVASTYRLWSRGKVIGLLSSVELVEELCLSIGVCVRRATNSCIYPIPSARDNGAPKAESYLWTRIGHCKFRRAVESHQKVISMLRIPI